MIRGLSLFSLDEHAQKRADLDDFVACYFGNVGKSASGTTRSTSRHQRKETERFKAFTYDDLPAAFARGYGEPGKARPAFAQYYGRQAM